MKRILVILFILLVLQGCSITRTDDYNTEQMIDKILSMDIKKYNTVGKGYKYYRPKGMKLSSSLNYNDILSKDNNVYYLYVDAVSYYYKSDIDIKKNKNPYFSKEIFNKDKKGYIEIVRKDNKLYVQMIYNYAKIETYINEKELKDVICDMSYVLASMDFNESLLKRMYESGDLNSKEEVYKLFDNKTKEGNFLEYIKEYDKYEQEDEEVKEEEIIIENTTTTKSTSDNENTTTKTNENNTTTN